MRRCDGKYMEAIIYFLLFIAGAILIKKYIEKEKTFKIIFALILEEACLNWAVAYAKGAFSELSVLVKRGWSYITNHAVIDNIIQSIQGFREDPATVIGKGIISIISGYSPKLFAVILRVAEFFHVRHAYLGFFLMCLFIEILLFVIAVTDMNKKIHISLKKKILVGLFFILNAVTITNFRWLAAVDHGKIQIVKTIIGCAGIFLIAVIYLKCKEQAQIEEIQVDDSIQLKEIVLNVIGKLLEWIFIILMLIEIIFETLLTQV